MVPDNDDDGDDNDDKLLAAELFHKSKHCFREVQNLRYTVFPGGVFT